MDYTSDKTKTKQNKKTTENTLKLQNNKQWFNEKHTVPHNSSASCHCKRVYMWQHRTKRERERDRDWERSSGIRLNIVLNPLLLKFFALKNFSQPIRWCVSLIPSSMVILVNMYFSLQKSWRSELVSLVLWALITLITFNYLQKKFTVKFSCLCPCCYVTEPSFGCHF